ncbi:MAG: hypothetical protein AB7T06_32990 [Kofleriaceae bacterium]
MLGTCPTAREIAIDDKVIGAASEGTSTLVDAMGTHCYATTRDSYGAMPVPSEREVLEPYAPGLYAIGQIDNWFVPNPTSTTVRVRDTENDRAAAATMLTSLMHTACDPRAARRRR